MRVDQVRILPNFFIAGAPKAGTSSLFSWIADHPDAVGSREKETYFFVDPGTHMYRPEFNARNGLDGYCAQFDIVPGTAPRVIFEATPAYLYMKQALERVPALPSRPKCLFVLREPSEQIFSLFQYFKDNWDWVPAEMSFAEFVQAVREGKETFKGNELAQNALDYARYVDFLVPWRAQLGPERLRVLTFEALVSDPRARTQEISDWLGLDRGFYETYGFPRENETYSPRSRALQRVNIMIRNALPKGRAYELVRSAYRRANTQKPSAPSTSDAMMLEALRSEYAGANAQLADAFDLDLTSWSGEA